MPNTNPKPTDELYPGGPTLLSTALTLRRAARTPIEIGLCLRVDSITVRDWLTKYDTLRKEMSEDDAARLI